MSFVRRVCAIVVVVLVLIGIIAAVIEKDFSILIIAIPIAIVFVAKIRIGLLVTTGVMAVATLSGIVQNQNLYVTLLCGGITACFAAYTALVWKQKNFQKAVAAAKADAQNRASA